MADLTESALRDAIQLAAFGIHVHESLAIVDSRAVLDGDHLYVRKRREGETLSDVLGSTGECIILPKREPWPIGPLVIPRMEASGWACPVTAPEPEEE